MNEGKPRDVICVDQLECRYGEQVILRDISFSVRGNEIFFIAGRRGCGKSTLLRHLLGLLVPARGRMAYFGQPLGAPGSPERSELLKSFGVLFQEDALWSDLSLLENVSLPMAMHTRLPKPVRFEIARLKLAQVGLAGYDDFFPRELSGGMQKRAALARALALDPGILFLDEPTAGQDPITARQIDELTLQVRRTVGATVVIVSHSLPSIRRMADRLLLLDEKARGIVAIGSPDEVAARKDIRLVREFFEAETGSPGESDDPGSAIHEN
jgi:phospholipid/cholesterol/gamma-HCH transport system ATP-binding protein